MASYSQCPNIEVDASEMSSGNSAAPAFIQELLKEEAPKYVAKVIELLEKIRNTWTGWSVLAAIRRHSKRKMVIKPWNKLDPVTFQTVQNATAGPTNATAATPKGKFIVACGDDPKTPKYNETGNPIVGPQGQVYRGVGGGSDTEVRFTAEMWTGTGSAPSGPGAEASEILFHEMVHGLRQMRGVMQCSATPDNPKYDTREEFMAILISNMYRSELRRPGLRADHHGFTPLPAALENPEAFRSKHVDYIHQLVEEDRALAFHLKNVNCTFNPVKLFYNQYPSLFGAGN